MQIMVEVSDDLALRLSPVQGQLPQILELGLREWNTDVGAGFSGLAEVLEFLASLPAPEEILALKPSEALQQQITVLLEKNRDVGLTMDEERLWQHYEYVEHLVRMAKAKALLKLQAA
jgi:hypothetical protein